MRVLVACEFSQVVTKAFRERGHEAFSCDIIPCEGGHPEWHIQDDVRNVLRHDFNFQTCEYDMVIAFPPCTDLAVSGAPSFKNKDQKPAIIFFEFFTQLATFHVAIENPVGIMSGVYRKPDQYIHPFQFGDPYRKKTGLWLKNLQPLLPTKVVEPIEILYRSKKTKSGFSKYSHLGKMGRGCGKERSVFPSGIAEAMAEQWGTL